jgi:iron complex outermembrane receptor protein
MRPWHCVRRERLKSDSRRTLATRVVLCAALACLAGAWMGGARAEPPGTTAIAPQPVADALVEFSEQTGVQLVYLSDIVRTRMSNGAPAGLAAAEALAKLLDGTGLGFEFINARTVRIFESAPIKPTAQSGDVASGPPPVERHGAGPPARMHDILVTGSREEIAPRDRDDTQAIVGSVNVMGGEWLETLKLEQLTDYASYVPGMVVAGQGSPGQSTVILRGVSPEAQASAVGFYIDDTPVGASGAHGSTSSFPLDLMPYDLDRVEVLVGPQQTLYGAGSEAGLIRYVLKAPSTSSFDAQVGLDVSEISGAAGPGASVRGMLNAPIVDGSLGLRLSVYDSHTPGYIKNAYTGGTAVNGLAQYGGRVAALWSPAESLSVAFNAFWHRIDSKSNGVESFAGITPVPNAAGLDLLRASSSFGDLTENHAFEQPFSKALDYYALSVNWNAGSVTVTSASAWSRSHTHQERDDTQIVGPNFPGISGGAVPVGLARFDRDLGLEKFSQELRLASATGRRIDWRLGAFYTHESSTDREADYAFDNAYRPIAQFAPEFGYVLLPSTFNEWAVYGELTVRVTDRLDLTTGARRSHSDQAGVTIVGGATAQAGIVGLGTGTFSSSLARQHADTATPWEAALGYHAAPDVMLYGRIATGYEPGLSNAGIVGAPPTVKAESLTSYEAGLKSEFLNRRFLLNVSAFYIAWSDVQVDIYVPGFFTVDGGNATTRGVELATAYSTANGFRIGVNAARAQSETTAVSTTSQFLSGYPFAAVPEWNFAFTTDYDHALTSAWHAHVGGAWRWVDHVWGQPVTNGGPNYVLPAYSVIDLNAAISKGTLRLKTFARNVTDKRGYQGSYMIFDTSNATAVQFDYVLVQPRTVGVGFDYAF